MNKIRAANPSYTRADEVKFFKALHIQEKDLYKKIFSFAPLFSILVENIRHQFLETTEPVPDLNLHLQNLVEAHGSSDQEKFDEACDVLGEDFRTSDAPRNWTVFIKNSFQTNWEQVDGVENFDFLKTKEYSAWKNQFEKAFMLVQNSKNKFITDNIGLIWIRIKKYKYKSMKFLTQEDLFQEGYFGMKKSIDKFDYKKNFRFSTYSTWWLRHKMQRAVEDLDSTIRIPVHISATRIKMFRFIAAVQRKENRIPTNEEIRKELRLSSSVADEVMSPAFTTSMDEMAFRDGENSFHEVIADDNAQDPAEKVFVSDLKVKFSKAFGILSDKEKAIVSRRFGLNSKSEEPEELVKIGHTYGLSRERIRQIESEALQKLRGHFRREDFAA